MSEILATYNLVLIGPPDTISEDWRAPLARTRTVLSPSLLRETEENLTSLLPDGYSVRILEWFEEAPELSKEET
jgi:hypothetical protein